MNYVENMIERYPALASCEREVALAVSAVVDCCRSGGKLLLLGNGGSAADAEHISGELLKGFLSKRPPVGEELSLLTEALGEDAARLQRGIPAIPLTSLTSVLSAFANDVSPELVYAQLVYALGKERDLVLGLSTSGNSRNVVAALKTAKALGI